MSKDFKAWFSLKDKLNNNTKGENILFHEREIWWCAFGTNIGNEQDGKGDRYARPVVIIKKHNMTTCLVAPLTKGGNNSEYYYHIGEIDGSNARINLSQIRLIDRKRLLGKLTMLNKQKFDELVRKLIKVNFPDV